MNKVYIKTMVISLFYVGLSISTSAMAVSGSQPNGFAIELPKEATDLSIEKTELPQKPTRIHVKKDDPYAMIKTVAGITFERFANQNSHIKENPNLLKDIVRDELMPYIDYKYSAYKVIGKYLKKTTADERRAFVPVFREYLVTSYAQVFTLYDNQDVQFFPAKNFENKRIVSVNTRIMMTGRDNIDVAFKVRLNRKTKEWKAFDMVAEGISLLDSKQAELGGIIRQKGLSYVTEILKKKSKRNIVFKIKKAKKG